MNRIKKFVCPVRVTAASSKKERKEASGQGQEKSFNVPECRREVLCSRMKQNQLTCRRET